MTKQMVLDEGRCRSQWKQWLAALAAILPIVMVGFLEMFVTVKHQIPSQYRIVTAEQLSGSAVLFTIIGCVIGAIFGAISADIFGRKRTLLATTICVVAGITGLFLTRSTICFMIPLIGGINAGITCTVVPVYISEIADDKIRGRLLMFQLLGIYFGQFIVITVAVITFSSMAGPIVMNICLIAIPILFLIAIYWFPESPYYLASKKQYEAAAKSLSFFRGIDQLAAKEEVQVVINSVEEESSHEGVCEKIPRSFSGNNRTGLVIITLLIIVQWKRMFIYETNDVSFALYTILPLRYIDAAMIISGTRLIWSVILVFTIDTVGRRRYLLGATLVGFAVASFTTVIDYASGLRIFSSVAIVNRMDAMFVVNLILHLCQIVIFAVPLVFVGELFPTSVRNIASSIVVIFGTIIKSTFLMINGGTLGTFNYDIWVFGPIYLLAFAFVLVFVPETKKKTILEIQNVLADTRLKCRRSTTSQYNQLIDTK